jgi:formate hydrogenlyase subunit 3/multisubunit Na+/H+ antiporter MnhD subunit
MSPQTLLLLPIVIPFVVAGVGLPFVRKSPRGLAVLSLLTVIASLLAFAGFAGSGAKVVQSWVGPVSLDFSVTSFKTLLLAFVFTLQLMIGIYLVGYLKEVERPFAFILALLLALGSASAVVLTDNLMVLLIFWEIFLVGLYVMIHSSGEHAERVAMKALVIGGTSDFLMIMGLLTYFWLGGTPDAKVAIQTASGKTALLAFVLVFLGAGAKAGMFPFHTWIPEAGEVMPAPGFAALPGSLEKILGISFLYVVCNHMFVLDGRARAIMYLFAVATAFVVIVPALVEPNLKRVLALTAISPVGFMIAGMATSEAAGIAGALMYMLTHATYKSAMFLQTASFEKRVGSTRLADLEGVGRVMPLSGFGFLLAFAAAISLPPTGGFMAKETIFEGLVQRGSGWVFALLWVAALLGIAVFSKLVAVLYARRHVGQRIEMPAGQAWSALLLGATALLTGLAFAGAGSAFGELLGEEASHVLAAPWHLGPLTLASLGVYLLGFMAFLGARQQATSPATTFDGLLTSPVFGRGLEMAGAKRFDAYEIGLKVMDWMTNVVFRHFERLIDVVVDGIIGIGRSLARHFLSAVHNGVYSTYLAWVLIGLVVVLSLVFGY